MRSFCRKTHVHKIPRFGGGFGGGGSADFIFMGARIFLSLEKPSRKRRDASPQSTCRAERNPGPRNPQIRNVQIRNLAVLEFLSKLECILIFYGYFVPWKTFI